MSSGEQFRLRDSEEDYSLKLKLIKVRELFLLVSVFNLTSIEDNISPYMLTSKTNPVRRFAVRTVQIKDNQRNFHHRSQTVLEDLF